MLYFGIVVFGNTTLYSHVVTSKDVSSGCKSKTGLELPLLVSVIVLDRFIN